MANKSLFRSFPGKLLSKTNTVNNAGGRAYRFDAKHALAQYAATGCMNATFYASAEMQLDSVLKMCDKVEPEFIARTALFARREGYMKDLPALLCAVLSIQGPGLLAEIFDRVIDNPKMLRNFVQIMRSGAVGRKSLGTLPKRLVLQWLEARSDEQLFFGSVGQSPSMADVIKMVHPKPKTSSREALYGYLIGRDHDADQLPQRVQQFEAYKNASDRAMLETPEVPFQMLTSLDLADWEWKAIARHAPWQMTRMNLNTFDRHGVFNDNDIVEIVCERLRNRQLIEKARGFPYQLMAAYMNASGTLPTGIRESLQDAMEIAIENVPQIDGKVYVFPDISGSMHSPVTGFRYGSSSAVRCIDVAALVAAAVLRKNPNAEIIPFESKAVKIDLNPRDSVMTNASKLASLPYGGTNCSAPLKELNYRKAKGDVVIYVSDNESWIDSPNHGWFGGSATATMKQWELFKRRNAKAQMVCIDLQPCETTQTQERGDITNVGGFSDQVFKLIADVASGHKDENFWVNRINTMRL